MSSDVSAADSAIGLISNILLDDSKLFLNYSVAIVAVAIGLLLDFVSRGVLFSNFAFIPLAAVAIGAVVSSYGPGLLSAALATAGLYYFFWLPADGQWNALGVAVAFVPIVFIIAYGAATIRGLYRASLRNAADLRAAVDERNELLSLVSQDFRTHLSTLKLNYGVLRILVQSAAPAIDEGLDRRFSAADREILRLTNLIDDVVEVSSAGRQVVNREEFDLADLAREIADSLSLQAEQANCALRIDLRPAVGRWDRLRLERVMLNLLANAIRYAPDSEITLRTDSTDGTAKLVVEDHGPGISQEKVRTLFQHPEQVQCVSDDGGLGLGLYVAKKIVDARGGKIAVQSRIGEGSIFTVELPL